MEFTDREGFKHRGPFRGVSIYDYREPRRDWPGWLLDLGLARLRAVPAEARVRCVQGDIQALPFVNAVFDVAMAMHMLYHVLDIPRAVAELRRVLRPGVAWSDFMGRVRGRGRPGDRGRRGVSGPRARGVFVCR